jgi:hypothetical protein
MKLKKKKKKKKNLLGAFFQDWSVFEMRRITVLEKMGQTCENDLKREKTIKM